MRRCRPACDPDGVSCPSESITWQLLAAAALMGVGVWLQLTDRHDHVHRPDELAHADQRHLCRSQERSAGRDTDWAVTWQCASDQPGIR